MPLELVKTPDDDDVFTIHIPKSRDLEDINFVLDNIEALTTFVDVFEEGNGTQSHMVSAQAALKQLILFCTKSDDTDPLTRLGTPITNHQVVSAPA